MTTIRREDLLNALPYARRYARAMSGSQARGDALVAEALKALLASGTCEGDARHLLYREISIRAATPSATAMVGLTTKQRQLLLLTTLEEVPVGAAAAILAMDPALAATELQAARDRLHASAATDVLIIEDEPIIAMDIEELVAGCGHRVIGVAATEADAVAIAERSRPGLILADINLGAGGDGTSAVSRIMRSCKAPVIFVTAYPERLLTGEALEPAFVITKPFEPLTLAIATYQAVTGGVNLD